LADPLRRCRPAGAPAPGAPASEALDPWGLRPCVQVLFVLAHPSPSSYRVMDRRRPYAAGVQRFSEPKITKRIAIRKARSMGDLSCNLRAVLLPESGRKHG